jgi:hypothetical protein
MEESPCGSDVGPAIDGQIACSTAARPKAREFGPAQARHGPLYTRPGPARPVYRARARAPTPARQAARPGTELEGQPGSGPLSPTPIYNQ